MDNTYTVTSSFADKQMPDSALNLIVPDLQKNKINAGLVLYNAPFLNCFGNTGSISLFDSKTYLLQLNKELAEWSAANKKFPYFNSTPSQVMLDFEVSLTDFINDWKSDAIPQLNQLNAALMSTKKSVPKSTVYHYATPYIPMYMDGYNISTVQKDSLETYNKLLSQFKIKINYIQKNCDAFDFSTYNPFCEDANEEKQKIFSSWIDERCKAAKNFVPAGKIKQITASFVLYPGFDNDIPYPTTLDEIEKMRCMIFTNNFMNKRIFSVAKSYDFTHLFLWENWYYRVILAIRNDQSIETYLQRKMLNDLFKDINPQDTGIKLTDDATWASDETKNKIYKAALTKTISLSILFRTR
jgi:hypothetical protein